jgi:hypothetical protein
VAKEKVTKEKSHPVWRLPDLLPGKSVSRGRAFRTGLGQPLHALPPLRHPCRRLPWRKGVDIRVDSRCAAYRPRLTAAQGPWVEQRASCAYFLEKPQATARAALRFGFSPSAGQEGPLLYPGAPLQRRAGEGKPAGWPAGMPASLAPGHDALSTNPVTRPRTLRAGMPAKRVSGVPLSLVTFSRASERK